MAKFEKRQGSLMLSTDKNLLNIDLIHEFLRKSYWSKNIPRETVVRGIKNSMAIGLYKNEIQIGFCRLITDKATFAYLADVFIIEKERGNGYSEFFIGSLKEIPALRGLRRWLLATRDAHPLYLKTGWEHLENPEYMMEIRNKDIYETKN